MSVIYLPTNRLPMSVNPKPLDFGGWQEPIAGGDITRLDRLGNRFSVDVVMPRMAPEPYGRLWVSALVRAIGQLVVLPFPQVGLALGAPGSSLIDGAGQTGTSLKLRNMTVGYTIREGQFLNGDDGTFAALFMSTSDQVVGSDGKVTVPIWPMIRHSPADGAPTYIAAPMITGRLSGNLNGWTLERAGTRGLQFTITETK